MLNFLKWLFAEPPRGQPGDGAQTFDAAGVVARDPALVTLYNPAGEAIHVGPDERDKWLQRGYRLTPVDLRDELASLHARFRAAILALEALIVAVEIDGEIDPHEEAALAAAQAATADLARGMALILTSAQLAYPMVQGRGVAMLDERGEGREVDPNQVDEYRERGWRLA